eukprot:Lankesteria_metandrocarpae@DN3042_c0_g1_i1.p1
MFQLGCGKKAAEKCERPELVHTLPDQVDLIATGDSHTICALRNGDVYGWGVSSFGRLGVVQKKRKIVYDPEAVVSHWSEVEHFIGGAPNEGTAFGGTSMRKELNDRTVEQFVESLQFPSMMPSFQVVQDLLKAEDTANKPQQLAEFESDLIKILGRYINIILAMPEREKEIASLQNQLEMRISTVFTHSGCRAPDLSQYAEAQDVLYNLRHFQELVTMLQIQPIYLVKLAASLCSEDEVNVYLNVVERIYWDVSDKRINSLFLAMAKAVAESEVQRCPDLTYLFAPSSSVFVHILGMYATKEPVMREYAPLFFDATLPNSLLSVMHNAKGVYFAMEPEKIASVTGKTGVDEVKAEFYKSVEVLKNALLNLAGSFKLPAGIALLLKHAYASIQERKFSVDFGDGSGSGLYLLIKPLVRVLFQGAVSRILLNSKSYMQSMMFPVPEDAFRMEFNFYTLGTFFNTGFNTDFLELRAGIVFREIFHEFSATMMNSIWTQMNIPDFGVVELTMSLYVSHFNWEDQHITIKSDDLLRLVNLLKAYEAHLNQSAFDPVADVVKKIAKGRNVPFAPEAIAIVQRAAKYHNLRVNNRFLLTDKNVVFDATTKTPVPQRLGLRQQAHTKDGQSYMSLLHRYVPPDDHDPNYVFQRTLEKCLPVRSSTFPKLRKEFLELQELCSRREPPDYDQAKLVGAAAKICEAMSSNDTPPADVMRWIGEGIQARKRQRLYLTMIQEMDQVLSQSARAYEFRIEKKKEAIGSALMSLLTMEEPITAKANAVNLRLKFDTLRPLCDAAVAELDAVGGARATATVSMMELRQKHVVCYSSLELEVQRNTKATFTSVSEGGWQIQLVFSNKKGSRTVGQFEISPLLMEDIKKAPHCVQLDVGDDQVFVVNVFGFLRLINLVVAGKV